MFKHKNQKQFYTDYAIKNGQVLDEKTLNLYGRRLKKELDDTYNLIAAFAALNPVEYNKNTSYETGEIVGYNNNAYISIKDSRGIEPTNTEYWKPFTEFAHLNNLTTLEDFIAKDNQNPYNPEELKEGENTIAYHPATVKYVEDSITDTLANGVITNADRLDGYHATDFVTKQQFLDLNESLKDLDISAFVPVSIEMPIDMNTLTKTPVGELIKVLPYEGFQNFFKTVNKKDHYNYRFNTNTITFASIEDTELQQTLNVCIAGPFKGFGCEEGDYTNGQLVLTLIMNKETKDYDEFRIESNCVKILTQAEYDAIENKSEYVQYVITDSNAS